MRASAKIFWILGIFFLVVAIGYALVTGLYEPHGIETVGFPALLALSGLGFMIGMALTINARRHELDASDDLDGEVSEAAGVQGSFSPYSWAPLWASLGALVGGVVAARDGGRCVSGRCGKCRGAGSAVASPAAGLRRCGAGALADAAWGLPGRRPPAGAAGAPRKPREIGGVGGNSSA